MTNQPRYFRKATSAPARLVLKGGPALNGIVKNVSNGGAKIEIDPAATVPSEFHLESAALDINADAVVVWRIGAHVGVRFLDVRPEVAPAPPPAVERRTIAVYRSNSFPG